MRCPVMKILMVTIHLQRAAVKYQAQIMMMMTMQTHSVVFKYIWNLKEARYYEILALAIGKGMKVFMFLLRL